MEIWNLSYVLPGKSPSEVLILYLGNKNNKYCGVLSTAFGSEEVAALKALAAEWKNYSGKMRYHTLKNMIDVNANYREYKMEYANIIKKHVL
jgi:hypothetical protein